MNRLGSMRDAAEFSATPIALDLHLDGFEGPRWLIKPFRNRSGWLVVADARASMSFCIWKQTLAVCLTDQGEVLSNPVSDAIFDMPTSLPSEVDADEPDRLEALMDDRELEFMREVDANNLRFLADLYDRTDAKIAAYELRCRKIDEGIIGATRFLRAERRNRGLSTDDALGIDVKLARLSGMADELASGMRERIRAMRAENDAVEAEVNFALGASVTLDRRCTIRWRAVSRWDRTIPGRALPQAIGWREDNFGSRMSFGPLGWGHRPYVAYD